MKIGDAVIFIGFKAQKPIVVEECLVNDGVGIVLKVYCCNKIYFKEQRVNVLWPDGNIGLGLYEETLEVISERI